MPFDFQFALVLVLVLVGGVFLFLARRRAPGRRYDTLVELHRASAVMLIGDADWTSLTKREKQVARRVAAGESNKQVAQALGISPQTVSAHLKNIYKKMNVQSRTQLAVRLRDIDD